jgi:putative nucleotidyltransferase-like protein
VEFSLPPSLWSSLYRFSSNKQWPPENADDAAAFVQFLAAEGLIPLMLLDASLPPAISQIRERYKAMDSASHLRTRVFEGALRTMLDIAGDEPVIVLKGTDYAYRFYPSPHLRPRIDVDVLVPLTRAKAVNEKLKQAGHQQSFPAGAVSRLQSHHEAVFKIGNALVEVHHSFIQRARNRVDYEGLWRRAKRWEGFDDRLLRLDDADGIVCHAVSMSTDEFSTAMFRYLDLWLMLRGREDILDAAVARAREWSTTRALYGALRQTSRYFPEFSTPAVERAMKSLLSPRTSAFMDQRVLPDPWAPRSRHGRPGRLWKKFWLIDDWRLRARFAAYHVYASIAGPVLQRRARDSDAGLRKTKKLFKPS